MGLLGLIDDFLNIKGIGKVKGLTAKMKLLWMFLFSAFIAYWFYVKLGVDWINLWPIDGVVELGPFFLVFVFFLTVFIVNAVNITDGLD
jgi:phospho-N-acetylmuramoyl-pentapeptide-transferase